MAMRHIVSLSFTILVLASPALAQPAGDELVCPAPVAVCGPGHGECPAGTECVCVSSCPACDDCAAFVCIDRKAECDSACDCPGTLGCFDGQCIAGFAPVYCCDNGECPSGQQCQFENGEMSRCDFSTCETRKRLLQANVDQMVANHNSCRSDDQCTWVSTRTDCEGSCGKYIRARFEARFARRIDRLDRRLCNGYADDGCPFINFECERGRAVCVNGRCTGG